MPLDDTLAVQDVLDQAADQLGVQFEEADVDLGEVLPQGVQVGGHRRR
jgi:hypothetical protein